MTLYVLGAILAHLILVAGRRRALNAVVPRAPKGTGHEQAS